MEGATRRGILVSLGPHQPSSYWPGWPPSLQGPMQNENAGPFVQSIKNFKRTTAKHSTKDRALLRARQCVTMTMKLVLPMAHIILQQRLPSICMNQPRELGPLIWRREEGGEWEEVSVIFPSPFLTPTPRHSHLPSPT